MTQPIIALTAGEPAGIGADLVANLAALPPRLDARIVVVADPDLLRARAHQLELTAHFSLFNPDAPPPEQGIEVLPIPLVTPVTAGVLNPANAPYVLATLDTAIDGCLTGRFAAMVTAPVHKGVINEAGIPFSGHTEYLADRTDALHVVMMLVGGGMRVALATTHLPLAKVPAAITPTLLNQVLRILHTDLVRKFGIAEPHIVVAGLNPHAGEGGHMGHEERDIIIPTLDKLRADGMVLTGPLPADTLFSPSRLQGVDAVLAMYHDQGLPVLKYASFGQGVNITLGLPIIRTSVDHGTALERAGTGDIHTGSLSAALEVAISLAHHHQP